MSLDQLVIRSARRTPDATAVVAADASLTYQELDDLANQIARMFAALGVQRGDRVGLWLEKSVQGVATMQAVLRLGAIYVPLDPLSPAPRVRNVLRDAGSALLVTTTQRAALVQTDDLRELICVCCDGEWQGRRWSDLRSYSIEPLDIAIDEHDPAYVLYTSGSTGVPKGVCISHRNALAFVEWAADEVGIGPSDRLANHAPFHFDLSVFDLYAAFLGGAAVVLMPEGAAYVAHQLVDFIRKQQITVWYSVPSALIIMLEQGGLLDLPTLPLRAILFAGEVFPIKHLRRLYLRWPTLRYLNLYGPTETNVCAFYEVQPADAERSSPVPIGRACSGDRIWAVDEHGAEVEPGATGELLVFGPTVMLGYWGQPPQGDRPYATGDLVRREADGSYTYVGRRDHLVKVRGHRIELGDIEAALLEHPAVSAAAVVVVGAAIEARLIAFLVADAEPAPSLLEIKRHCAERLPRYMIVDSVEFCAELPRTGNGKIDRLKLAAEQQSRSL